MIFFSFVLIPIGFIIFVASKIDMNRNKRSNTYAIVCITLPIVSIAVGYFIVTFGTGYATVPSNRLYEIFCIASLAECFLIGIIFAFKKYANKDSLSYGIIILYMLFPLFQIVSLKIVENVTDEWLNKRYVFSILSTLFAIIGDLSVLFFFVTTPSYGKLLRTKESFEANIRTRKTSALRDEEILAVISREEEEFFHIITDVEGLVSIEDYEGAIDSLDRFCKKSATEDKCIYCDNKYVNELLSEKSMICKSSGILFDCDAKVPKDLKIDSIVLCSVFGNMLDNAINACNVYEGNDKKISISSGIQGDYLMIFVDNSADNNSVKSDNTRKHYGQQIIREYATRYNGHFNTYYDKKIGEYRAELALVNKGPEVIK